MPRGGARPNSGPKTPVKKRRQLDAAYQIQRIFPLKERVKLLTATARDPHTKPADKERIIRQLNEYHLGKPVDRSELGIFSDQPIAVAFIPPIKKEEQEEIKGE